MTVDTDFLYVREVRDQWATAACDLMAAGEGGGRAVFKKVRGGDDDDVWEDTTD